MPRVALVLSGGGAKGAFSVGVLLELLPRLQVLGRTPGIIAATSTGSFIAPMAFTDRLPQLALFYTSLSTPQILALRTPGQAFSHPALADPAPIRNLVTQNLTAQVWNDILTQGAAGRTLLVSGVSLQTGELFMFHAGAAVPASADKVIQGVPAWRYAEVSSVDQLRNAVLASGMEPARLDPVAMSYEPVALDAPRMRVTGIGGQPQSPWRPPFTAQFVDGGVRTLAPVEVAIAMGADEVFLVANQPNRMQRIKPALDQAAGGVKSYGDTASVLIRTLDILQLRVGDADEGAGQPLGVKFHVIRPDPPLVGDSLDFSQAMMAARLSQGRQTGQAFVNNYQP
jgi:predicted acylesterase/phospholipase RssA